MDHKARLATRSTSSHVERSVAARRMGRVYRKTLTTRAAEVLAHKGPKFFDIELVEGGHLNLSAFVSMNSSNYWDFYRMDGGHHGLPLIGRWDHDDDFQNGRATKLARGTSFTYANFYRRFRS